MSEIFFSSLNNIFSEDNLFSEEICNISHLVQRRMQRLYYTRMGYQKH